MNKDKLEKFLVLSGFVSIHEFVISELERNLFQMSLDDRFSNYLKDDGDFINNLRNNLLCLQEENKVLISDNIVAPVFQMKEKKKITANVQNDEQKIIFTMLDEYVKLNMTNNDIKSKKKEYFNEIKSTI